MVGKGLATLEGMCGPLPGPSVSAGVEGAVSGSVDGERVASSNEVSPSDPHPQCHLMHTDRVPGHRPWSRSPLRSPCPWPWGFRIRGRQTPSRPSAFAVSSSPGLGAAASGHSQHLRGPVGRPCCGVHVWCLDPAGIPGAVGTLLPKLFCQLVGLLGAVPCGTWVVASGWGCRRAPGASGGATFRLRPRVGSEGHLQGLCPRQPGAEAAGRVLLAGCIMMWFHEHSAPTEYRSWMSPPHGSVGGGGIALGSTGLQRGVGRAGPEILQHHLQETDAAGVPGEFIWGIV